MRHQSPVIAIESRIVLLLRLARISHQSLTRLIAILQRFCCRFIISSIEAFLGEQEINGTHRPVTNKTRPPFDGLPKTFERDDALWSDNEYSDVVLFQDSTIRVSQDQSQRARLKKERQRYGA